jgi:hypothetical protein
VAPKEAHGSIGVGNSNAETFTINICGNKGDGPSPRLGVPVYPAGK